MPRGHQPGASLHRAALQGEDFATLSVPVVALDDYFGESDRIGLLKIDVEGAELEGIQGRRADPAPARAAARVRV